MLGTQIAPAVQHAEGQCWKLEDLYRLRGHVQDILGAQIAVALQHAVGHARALPPLRAYYEPELCGEWHAGWLRVESTALRPTVHRVLSGSAWGQRLALFCVLPDEYRGVACASFHSSYDSFLLGGPPNITYNLHVVC